MVPPRTDGYSEPFDMQGHTRLGVEALVMGLPDRSPATATFEVHGTCDGAAEPQRWAVEGPALTLALGVWERRAYYDVRPFVRLRAVDLPPGGPWSVGIRLTRLP
jgi:hypothetical protein